MPFSPVSGSFVNFSLSLPLSLSLRPRHTLPPSRAFFLPLGRYRAPRKCGRLEKAFRARSAIAPTSEGSWTFSTRAAKAEGKHYEQQSVADENPGGGGGVSGTSADARVGGGGGDSGSGGGDGGEGGGRRGASSVAYQPTGGMVLEFHSYEVGTQVARHHLSPAHHSSLRKGGESAGRPSF